MTGQSDLDPMITPTRGGSFDGPGPTIVDGMVYVNSGYGFQGGMGGNALIAFSVDGE